MSIRIRRAHALVACWEEARCVVLNFLLQKSLAVTSSGLEFLSSLSEWCTLDEGLQRYDGFAPDSVMKQVELFADAGLIVVEGSQEAMLDERYAVNWEWGFIAAAHCFSSKDVNYLTVDECVDFLKERREALPSPALLLSNIGLPDAGLPPPRRTGQLFDVMYSRRSIRKWAEASVSLQDLSDVLFAGLGVTAFVEDPDLGTLPLTMTPSGGARNPIEAYVAVQRVEGLSPGIYHYAGADRSLARVSKDRPMLSHLLGNQEWANDAALVVLLVANWGRTMWKYPHPSAYRVVLIEAGHIAQNLLLAAADVGLVGVPTCATGDSVLESALRLDRVTQAVVHTVALGRPRAEGSWTDEE